MDISTNIRSQPKGKRRTSLLMIPALAGLAFAIGLLLSRSPAALAASGPIAPPPAVDEPAPAGKGYETAVFSGGCFWGVQGVFQHVKGVIMAVSGYAGGEATTAHYDWVSTGTTGHAESVQITYDPKQVSYGQLLQIFFSVVHDPTQKNRQGPDHGTQYRSAIFTDNATQEQVAKQYIAQLDAAGVFDDRIVTTTGSLHGFYAAEDYHQNYLSLHPNDPYIEYNDIGKVRALKEQFPALYREQPVLALPVSGPH